MEQLVSIDAFLDHMKPWVEKVTNRNSNPSHPFMSQDDLRQEAALVLLEAYKKYGSSGLPISEMTMLGTKFVQRRMLDVWGSTKMGLKDCKNCGKRYKHATKSSPTTCCDKPDSILVYHQFALDPDNAFMRVSSSTEAERRHVRETIEAIFKNGSPVVKLLICTTMAPSDRLIRAAERLRRKKADRPYITALAQEMGLTVEETDRVITRAKKILSSGYNSQETETDCGAEAPNTTEGDMVDERGPESPDVEVTAPAAATAPEVAEAPAATESKSVTKRKAAPKAPKAAKPAKKAAKASKPAKAPKVAKEPVERVKKVFKKGTELVYQGGGRCDSLKKGDVVIANKPLSGGSRYWVRRPASDGKPGVTTQVSSRYLLEKK